MLTSFAIFLALAPSGILISNQAIVPNPATGKIYVVDTKHDSVSIIDGAKKTSMSVRVGAGPDALAINRATGKVYVANAGGGTVSVLDGETNSVTATIKAGPHPYVLAVDESANKVFVTNTFSDLVAVIDGATNAATFWKVGSADNIVVDGRTHRVFLLGYEDPNIRVVDEATEAVETISAHEHLWGMALDATGSNLYLTVAGSAQLLSVELASREITRVPVGSIPCAIALNSKTGMSYVVNYAGDSVTAVSHGAAVANIKVGKGPQAVAVDVELNRVYVANTHGDSVTVVDGATNVPVATVPAGQNPFAITTQAGAVYVANLGERSFTEVKAAGQ